MSLLKWSLYLMRLNYQCSPFYIDLVDIGERDLSYALDFWGFVCLKTSNKILFVLPGSFVFFCVFSSSFSFHVLFLSPHTAMTWNHQMYHVVLLFLQMCWVFFLNVSVAIGFKNGKIKKNRKSTSKKEIEEKLSENTKLFKNILLFSLFITISLSVSNMWVIYNCEL